MMASTANTHLDAGHVEGHSDYYGFLTNQKLDSIRFISTLSVNE